VKLGTVNAEVHIESDHGDNLVSVITKESAERLGLKVGMEVFAVIKASSIMIAIN
jgi:molybdopterin-binding protein